MSTAIDEIAVRKGHSYMTIVVDLDRGTVLYAAEGNDHESLQPFFRRLRRAQAKLEAIAVDMGSGYRKAIDAYAPAGVVVHDRYHVVAAMNEVVDHVRREEQNRLDGQGKNVVKGSRYLLLRGSERLAEMPEKKTRLDELLALNEPLQKVYLLKEDLRLFWSQGTKEDAQQFVDNWLREADALGNRHVSRFARTIRARLPAILAWYDHPISTGPLEGLNNKIKVLKRVAYGYRDIEFFKLRVMFLHDTEFRLAGV